MLQFRIIPYKKEWNRIEEVLSISFGAEILWWETEKNKYAGMRRSSRGIAKGSRSVLATGI